MKYTHAITVRVPATLKFEDKKAASKVDLQLAARQHQDLSDTLREAGVEVIELPPEPDSPVQGLFAGDVAIVINGTALLTRPHNGGGGGNKRQNQNGVAAVGGLRTNEFVAHLNALAWQVVEAPAQIHGRPLVLEGSDVVFTGREIFVGIRKNGTNTEGALFVAKTFADYSVIPIPVGGNQPLKAHISVATSEILAVGKDKESQCILKRIERDATFRYRVLLIENGEAINCLTVNNRLIFRHDLNELKFRVLQPPIELWGVSVGELVKLGGPFSRYCLLIQKLSAKRHEQ